MDWGKVPTLSNLWESGGGSGCGHGTANGGGPLKVRSPSARKELVLLVDSISTENDSFLVTNAIVLAVLMLQTTGDSSKEVLGEISVDTFAKLTDIAMLSLFYLLFKV